MAAFVEYPKLPCAFTSEPWLRWRGAVIADEYYGITYALADENENKLIYFKLDFCNFFTDINYESRVDAKYLPAGFDAKDGNATRKAFISGELIL